MAAKMDLQDIARGVYRGYIRANRDLLCEQVQIFGERVLANYLESRKGRQYAPATLKRVVPLTKRGEIKVTFKSSASEHTEEVSFVHTVTSPEEIRVIDGCRAANKVKKDSFYSPCSI